MTRILTTLALAVVLTISDPAAALAAPTPSPSSAVVRSSTDDSRIGGTPGTPGPGTPGWVWWVGAAMVLALGAGGVRLWRNRWLEEPPRD